MLRQVASAFAEDAFGNASASWAVSQMMPKPKGGIDNIASSLDPKRLGQLANEGIGTPDFTLPAMGGGSQALVQTSGSAAVDAATALAVKEIISAPRTLDGEEIPEEMVITGVRPKNTVNSENITGLNSVFASMGYVKTPQEKIREVFKTPISPLSNTFLNTPRPSIIAPLTDAQNLRNSLPYRMLNQPIKDMGNVLIGNTDNMTANEIQNAKFGILTLGMPIGRGAKALETGMAELNLVATNSVSETSTVFRVQGGVPPLASRDHIVIGADGNPRINNTTLNISIGDAEHAEYFKNLRPGSEVVSFDIPKWMDDFIHQEAIPQANYRSNPLNQGGLAPKIVDPATPGRSYELPSIWTKWLQENAIPGSGKVTK